MKHDNLNKFKNSFSDYTELRVQENRNNRLNLTNGDVTGNVAATTSGVSARVFKDGKWGFSSSPDINQDSTIDIVDVVQFILEQLELISIQEQLADIDQDGLVNVVDIIELVSIILN